MRHHLILLLAIGVSASADAQSTRDSTRALDTVRVTGRIDDLRGTARTAAEGRIGAAELRTRPLMREGEMLEAVPGVIVTQHSGDGKANQYFVRGFNLDHGTDFATSLDGMPLNMRTHAHGQGYTDLNFLIPELIDHVEYQLGVSHAEVGDFGSAGAAQFSLATTLARPMASLALGENGFRRAFLGRSLKLGTGSLLLAAESRGYDGPWLLAEHAQKLSGVAKYSFPVSATTQLALTALAYHNQWRSTDQIPLRAVTEGLVGRFSPLDTTDGGVTSRYSLSASLQHVGNSSLERTNASVVYSDLALFSNFTYFLDDPLHGDQFSQSERRVIAGGDFSHQQNAGIHAVTVGADVRADFINGLALKHTEARQTLATTRRDDVREGSGGLFVNVQSHWNDRLRSTVGVRADAYDFVVRSRTEGSEASRVAALASPKVSLAYQAAEAVELYASAGLGFHSNDARGAVDGATPLVRSRGLEVGLRTSPITNLRSTLTAWMLNLDSELLFVGDAGMTEESHASKRRGVTVASFYKPLSYLALDADVSFAHAELSDVEERFIPGALERVVAAGVTVEPEHFRVFGSLRLRHFSGYPLNESGARRADASSLVNGDVGVRIRPDTRVQLTVLNVLDAAVNDIQYAYASRLKGETADGVDDVHFHPAEPRQFRLGVTWQW